MKFILIILFMGFLISPIKAEIGNIEDIITKPKITIVEDDPWFDVEFINLGYSKYYENITGDFVINIDPVLKSALENYTGCISPSCKAHTKNVIKSILKDDNFKEEDAIKRQNEMAHFPKPRRNNGKFKVKDMLRFDLINTSLNGTILIPFGPPYGLIHFGNSSEVLNITPDNVPAINITFISTGSDTSNTIRIPQNYFLQLFQL